MDNISVIDQDVAERVAGDSRPLIRRRRRWPALALVGVMAMLAAAGGERVWRAGERPAPPPPPPPQVTVSPPLQKAVQATGRFLGQFSAVDSVELRAQVGGTLTAIAFRDGQIVHKGDLLFVDRPAAVPDQARPGRRAVADRAGASRRWPRRELWRAQQLKRTDFGTAENVDQRAADQRSAQAAIETAKAAIRDAQLDLEFSRVTAPFTGRIGAHLVSVGSLVSGSRGGTGPTTLLATIVSLDPIYLDFDMSEADYLAYQQAHHGARAARRRRDQPGRRRAFRPPRHARLHRQCGRTAAAARSTRARRCPIRTCAITPGQFARLRVATRPAGAGPAGARRRRRPGPVAADRHDRGAGRHGRAEAGRDRRLYHGLRVIRSGLAPTDRVVIDGLVRVRPGAKVTPVARRDHARSRRRRNG